jgi:hypothetical protein
MQPESRLHVYKVILPRGVDSLPGQDGCVHVVMGAVDDVVDDVPGMAGIQADSESSVIIFHEIFKNVPFKGDRVALAYFFEDCLIFCLGRMINLDFIADPAQERLVGKRFGLDIG